MRADPGLALRYDWIGKSDDVDALLEHGVGKAAGEGGIAEHDGRDGMRAFENLEAIIGQLFTEIFCVGLETIAQLGGFVEQVDGFDGGGHDTGRDGIGE